MSVSLGTYFGPALLAKKKLEIIELPPVSCGNRDCAQFQKALTSRYCPHCGGYSSKHVAGETAKIISPNKFKIAGLVEKLEGMHGKDYEYPFYNGDRIEAPPLHDFLIPDDTKERDQLYGGSTLIVEGIDFEAEKKDFAVTYATEIKMLETIYESVEVKWIAAGYFC